MFSRENLVIAAAAAAAAVSGWRMWHSFPVEPAIHPPGQDNEATTRVLDLGSAVMQSAAPLRGMHTYMVGFHPMKDDACHQMEAHHYCKQVNEDFAQCVLFDSNASDANLTGVEYIISDHLYTTLSNEERQFWHPHNYEILSGQLTAPGLPEAAEDALLKKRINSYGKTYHTWRAKCWEGERPFLDRLPLGPALLAWSFVRDGQIKPELQAARDEHMRVDTASKKKHRAAWAKDARPQ